MELHPRTILNPRLLLLDGLSRSGKFLLGKVISHFERVEFFQFSPILEYLPIYWRLGCFQGDSVVPILRTTVDLLVYERAIGRHLNFRVEDDTAIYKAPDYERYLKRTIAPRGWAAREEMVRENRYSAFLTHEVLPNVPPYFEAYPEMKMINFQRHPVDVIHSWHRKSLGATYSTDPAIFRPLVRGQKMPVPWFAWEWAQDYERMSPVDRVIRGVLQLNRLEQEAYALLSSEQKKRILFISYEELVETPEKVLPQVSEFLETLPMKNIREILTRERCFRDLPASEREKKYEELAAEASKELAEELSEASKAYESRWSLKPFFSPPVVTGRRSAL